jgi:hypothetical protein
MPNLTAHTETDRVLAGRDKLATWKKFGRYLSERQWGTVREDYSPKGNTWNYFLHE